MRQKIEGAKKTEPGGFVFTDGDLEILRLIHEHRFLRREQISQLCGRHAKRLHRRITKLVEHGYISTIRLPQQKHIYGIGRSAIPVLIEQGLSEPEVIDKRLRTHELKELFLKHEMMIVDVHVALTLASRSGDVKLVRWMEGPSLYDSVIAIDNKGSSRLPIRPDAFFSLEDSLRPEGGNRAHFVLEADRSTTTQLRFEDKVRAYWHYIERSLPSEKLGVKTLRVLTVTFSDQRARNLCAQAATTLPERMQKCFLFGAMGNWSERTIPSLMREQQFYSPRSIFLQERHALVAEAGKG